MLQSNKIAQNPVRAGATLICPTFVGIRHNNYKILVRSRISQSLVSSPPRHRYATHQTRVNVPSAAAASENLPPQDVSAHRNVVIAVDTSPAAQGACRWALQELIRPGDVVHLAHCVPSFPSQGLYTLPDGRLAVVNFEKLLHNESEYLKAAQRVVSEWAWEIFHPANVPFVVDVIKEQDALLGDKRGIANLLCKKAEELRAAALILCPHGKGGLGELLMGSVAADCGRYCADTPVVVLHEPSRTTGDNKKKKSTVVTWLSQLLVREIGHPDTVGTAAEVIAESAANGPLHTGRNSSSTNKEITKQKGKSEPSSSFSLSSLSEEESGGTADTNLIGQAVGEVPGTDIDFSDTSPSHKKENVDQTTGRTIVVTVDDSEASSHAAAWAAHHMWRKGDKLHLLHVIPSLPSVAYGAGPMAGLAGSFLYVLEPPTAAYKEATEKYMETRFHGMLRDAGVDFTSDILLEMIDGGVEGVGQALLNRAEAVGASAVVVGSRHGTGGLGELLLGSVGQWLAHHSLNIPVVILH